jgi:ABC-type Na+ efflux pump permease subunit
MSTLWKMLRLFHRTAGPRERFTSPEEKKQSEERAALFAVRVHVIAMFFFSPVNGVIEFLNAHGTLVNNWNWLIS